MGAGRQLGALAADFGQLVQLAFHRLSQALNRRPGLFHDFGNQVVGHVQTAGQDVNGLQPGMVPALGQLLSFLQDFLRLRGEFLQGHVRLLYKLALHRANCY